MEIVEVTQKEFKNVIYKPFHVYEMADFNKLNEYKCTSVHYFLFRESKYRLGFVGGVIDNVLSSPFSAPFGGFVYIKDNVGIEFIDEAIELLVAWSKSNHIRAINVTLPPPFYSESFITKQVNSLYRKNFQCTNIELNYVFFTDKFKAGYIDSLDQKSRNNLNNAIKQDFKFHKCKNTEEKELAYKLIEHHKKFKKYPLKMSWQQIMDTSAIIDIDFFLLYLDDKTPIASAMVYHVSESIVQIIYWGDVREYSNLRVMNFLAYKLFEYYSETHKLIDLGPSSENSVPNIGLCRFKEKIGCDLTTKVYFELILVPQFQTIKMIHHSSDVQSSNIGDETQIWQFCTVLPGAVIGKGCNINCNVFIENKVRIGDNVTVKSGVQVWDGVTLEDNVFVGPNATFTNDLFPRSKNYQQKIVSTLIKKGASIGANATILAGITIGEYAMIGAASIVTKNVPDYELWFGHPAKKVGYITKQGEVLNMNLVSKKTGNQFYLKDGVPTETENDRSP